MGVPRPALAAGFPVLESLLDETSEAGPKINQALEDQDPHEEDDPADQSEYRPPQFQESPGWPHTR